MGVVLLSILGWGVAGALGGLVARRASVSSLMFWGPFISSPLVLIPLLFGGSLGQPLEVYLFVFLSYLSLIIAWSFYWRALKLADASLVVALGATYPLVSLAIFLLLGKTSWGIFLLLGSTLISLGVFLMHLENKRYDSFPWKALLLGLGAASAWGFWGFFDWQSLQYAGPFDVILVFFLFSPLLPLALFLLSRFQEIDLTIDRKTVFLRLAASLSATVALISLYYALAKSAYPTVVIALAATYPLVTLGILLLLKKEKLTWIKTGAIVLTILGVIVLQVYRG
jgi:drug/metabolite transporter (DMT)-like permease